MTEHNKTLKKQEEVQKEHLENINKMKDKNKAFDDLKNLYTGLQKRMMNLIKKLNNFNKICMNVYIS